MKWLRIIIQFLGGIPFAVILIAASGLFVALGTLMESATQSHQYAAYFIYESKIFACLLAGFFINILVSALRRWPFRAWHIPFLITHLGLLMIISGLLIKNAYGVQGNMNLIEGSGTNEISIPNSHFLAIEERGKQQKKFVPVEVLQKGNKVLIPQKPHKLEIQLLAAIPHSSEKLDTWIKDGRLMLQGNAPIPLRGASKSVKVSPVPITIAGASENWFALASDCLDVEEYAKQAFIEGTRVILTDRKSQKQLMNMPLKDLLKDHYQTEYQTVLVSLNFDWSSQSGFNRPAIITEIENTTSKQLVTIELNGSKALLNKYLNAYGQRNIAVDLVRPAELHFLKGSNDDIYLFAFNSKGEVYAECFSQDHLKNIFCYDGGHGGYVLQENLPFLLTPADRTERETAIAFELETQLGVAEAKPDLLPVPMKMLLKSCQLTGVDFKSIAKDFLSSWYYAEGWLCSPHAVINPQLTQVLHELDWDNEPDYALNGSRWNVKLFKNAELLLHKGETPAAVIDILQWPTPLPEKSFAALCVEIYKTAHLLPNQFSENTDGERASVFSAYCQAYGIDPCNFYASDLAMAECIEKWRNQSGIIDCQPVQIECTVTNRSEVAAPSRKFEENLPSLLLQFKEGKNLMRCTLTYDRFSTKMKWPILVGKYLVRYQPLFKPIPYRLRLRQARQINYAGSNQPYSYECDLLVTETANGIETEKTISMNDVHETWDGYRFYLSNVSPSSPGEIKHVQIVVNYDPVKYIVTYPGAIVLSLGIILLFNQRRRRS